MRTIWSAMCVVCLVGCGVERAETGASAAVGTKRDALVFPSTPTDVARLTPPYLPTTFRSAYVVTVADPTDTSAFLTWVYDVRASRALLFVRGDFRTQFAGFSRTLQIEIATQAASGADSSFGWGMAGWGPGHPPGPGPGGGDYRVMSRMAYNASVNVANALEGAGFCPPESTSCAAR